MTVLDGFVAIKKDFSKTFVLPMNDSESNTFDFLNEVFKGNCEHAEEIAEEIEKHQEGQDPRITTIACSDSRVKQQEMWKNDLLGQEFTKGVIGNHVNVYTSKGDEVVSGSVDYIPEHSTTETVVAVIGHTGCGAVTATYETLAEIESDKGLEQALNLSESELNSYNGETKGINSDIKLLMSSGLVKDYRKIKGTSTKQEEINKLVEKNVDNQVRFLKQNTNYEDTAFVGLVYDMEGGYNQEKGRLYLVNFEGKTSLEKLEDFAKDHSEISAARLN